MLKPQPSEENNLMKRREIGKCTKFKKRKKINSWKLKDLKKYKKSKEFKNKKKNKLSEERKLSLNKSKPDKLRD